MSVLHFIEADEEVAGALEKYRSLLPGGSLVAASHITEHVTPEELAESVRAGIALYQRSSTPIRSRGKDEFARFFTGLDLVEPGITTAPDWHPELDGDAPSPGRAGNPAYSVYLAGVARKNG